MKQFDLAIIGGGPGGYVAAERAGAKGLNVVLFEKRELGGVCLNEGCVPTKTLLYSAKIYDSALNGDKYGVKAGEVTFDYGRIVARKNKVVRKLVAGVSAKMKAHHVEVVKGEAFIDGRSDKGVEITCGEEKYVATNLLLCTGSEAFVPPIEGIKEAGEVILTNREILAMKEQPSSLVIIGGGVIGMEFASFFNSLGTEVTVIEMLPEILGGIDAEISAMLREVYTKKGVRFNCSCKVVKVNGNTVHYLDPEGNEQTVSGDKILVSVGRRAVTAGFGLENLGVELDRGAVKVDNQMRTNVPGVYAAGDVTGFSMLAHTASREGEVVVNNLTGRKDVMRYDAVPGVVYTNPEVASVGLTIEAAKAKGLEAKELQLPMAYAGRFVAENEGGNGLCKVVVGEKHGQVLGVHMIGNPCSEMIYGACIAIEQEMTVKELEEVIFPHPTVSEIFKETIFTMDN
ncbi:dihydrolipoamide dehydrogenase [Parabacteroides sp. PFB2-10]|uniref:dihydrolipoyl dehydrogenase n=1 Tax=Parabacteroides sp. PFB2-10 TaxID=1742405 RepID=UPI002476A394|nr:dihydrolipoyl dehydrogenase [Parabacteroides sp. PFB2-10]MDH6313188.1 dihydrolipoamide dehydrogenase [Parabacteroides sp. PFB2-10]MDL2244370.1 dihydrolipoyl dehydrogenase [Parabacteroides sp. OttesenSCG-928-J18]